MIAAHSACLCLTADTPSGLYGDGVQLISRLHISPGNDVGTGYCRDFLRPVSLL